jgi:hypothetical protein
MPPKFINEIKGFYFFGDPILSVCADKPSLQKKKSNEISTPACLPQPTIFAPHRAPRILFSD